MPSQQKQTRSKPTRRGSEKTAFIQRALLAWFRKNARDLPWRRTDDPYAIWLSEIILQQTRVDQGTPYFERFLTAFPTVFDLASAHEDRVLKLWEGLGYYSRARNLHKAAKHIANDCGGDFPCTAEEWLAIPGVGRYTAGAIASIAFGERVPVLDGNVIRVLARIFAVTESTDDAEIRNRLWSLATQLVPPRSPGDFNEAIMELGATICTPKSPSCKTCPVHAVCSAYSRGIQERLPVRTAKKKSPKHELVCAVIECDGEFLVGKRPGRGLLGGLWEFPNGEVAKAETHQTALKRTARDLAGLRIKPGKLIASVEHVYSHLRVTMTAYRCTVESRVLSDLSDKSDSSGKSHSELRWVKRAQFAHFAMPKVILKFLDLV
jgi:A/G-specific adenine glycosylase